MFKWVTKSSLAVALFGGWSSVTVNVNEAGAIADRFDIKFGMNKACAGYEKVGSDCRDTTYTVTLDDGCGNVSSYDIPGSVCWDVYGFVPDGSGSSSSSEPPSYTCADYSSCDDSDKDPCD